MTRAVRLLGIAACLVLGACAGGAGGSGAADPSLDRQDFEVTKTAATGGDANAQIALADMHRLGVGTPRDVGQAAALYRKPAEQGNPLAQYNLGEAYRSGYGLPQNLSEAANWFAKAAARGNPLAQYRLGVLLLKGQGVALDPAEALLWLTVAEPRLRAAETNPSWSGYAPEVKDALARLPSLRAQATKRLRAPELERVRRDAAAWKPSS